MFSIPNDKISVTSLDSIQSDLRDIEHVVLNGKSLLSAGLNKVTIEATLGVIEKKCDQQQRVSRQFISQQPRVMSIAFLCYTIMVRYALKN